MFIHGFFFAWTLTCICEWHWTRAVISTTESCLFLMQCNLSVSNIDFWPWAHKFLQVFWALWWRAVNDELFCVVLKKSFVTKPQWNNVNKHYSQSLQFCLEEPYSEIVPQSADAYFCRLVNLCPFNYEKLCLSKKLFVDSIADLLAFNVIKLLLHLFQVQQKCCHQQISFWKWYIFSVKIFYVLYVLL